MRSLPILLSIAVAGCAPQKPPFTWMATPTDTRALADKYPHALAVMLTREERLVFTFDASAPATQIQRHDVIAILAEGGDRFADVAVPVGTGRLQFLQARTIGADGRIDEVTPEEVHTPVAHVGSWLKGADVAATVFRLPNVRPGSVIEYAYGIESSGRLYSARRPISAPIPTVHYHAEIAAVGPVELSLRVYNGREQTNVVKEKNEPDGQTMKIDQRDIPAAESEPFAPPPTVTEPYWAVAVVAMGLGTGRARTIPVGVYDGWSHALYGLSSLLYEQKADSFPKSGLTAKLDGCARGPRCIAERALMLVNRLTDLSSFVADLAAIRPLKEILASKMANNVEKAMMLVRALDAAGVRASFVVLARNLVADFDPKFPSGEVFDHLIVRVDQQPGLEEPLFVDPSCEMCALGELPAWANDRYALVFGKPTDRAGSYQREAPVELVRLHASEPAANVRRTLIDAAIDANGAMSGRISDQLDGAAAVEFRLLTRSWLPDRWRRELENDLHDRARTAALGGAQPPVWDKREAQLTFGTDFAVPGYATSDGARQIVPLSILRMAWDRDLGAERRRHDVLLREGTREEETMVIHLPKGWTATELPRSASWHCDALDAVVNVTSGDGVVTVRRIVQTHAGHWGPAEFDDISTIARKLAAIRQAAFAIAPPTPATR